jgi:hypothetical protein
MSDSLVRDQQHRFMSKFLSPSFPFCFLLFVRFSRLAPPRLMLVSISSIARVSLPRDPLSRTPFGSILFPCFTDLISVCYITCTSLYHVQQSEYRLRSPPFDFFPSIPRLASVLPRAGLAK